MRKEKRHTVVLHREQLRDGMVTSRTQRTRRRKRKSRRASIGNFEHPVNQFIDQLRYRTFPFTSIQTRLLTGYLTMLFHRSPARRDASEGQQNIMVASLRAIRADESRLAQLVAKYTADL